MSFLLDTDVGKLKQAYSAPIYKFPSLPYPFNALEPVYDTRTVETHYTVHHKNYVDKLNQIIAENSLEDYFQDKKIEDVLANIDFIPRESRQPVLDQGGGAFNHQFFWEGMVPGGSQASRQIENFISEKYGSFEKFKDDFNDKAISHVGSGWTWLTIFQGMPFTVTTENHGTPFDIGHIPLLCIDIWEHAYYLKFTSDKKSWVTTWWNLVNWKKVEERIKSA